MTAVTLDVNGKAVTADVEPRTSLADFLRNQQFLTGTHLGCEHGVCGSCTVMINDAPARSCIAFAVSLDGSRVRTIEGFETDAVMEKLREAFRQEHGVQCGYCTPGMLITSRDIVTRFAAADEKKIRTELAGNLCRCTGYVGIVKAIQRVMREMPATARLEMPAQEAALPPPAKPFRGFDALVEAPQLDAASPATATESTSGRGWFHIADQFVVAAPRDQVWNRFADFAAVARCMPGAELTSSDGREMAGNVRIAFGPIKARFSGVASVEHDISNFTGLVRGGGNDAKGGSRAKGQVTYRLIEEQAGSSTRVELSLEFQLQGPLAQFGRSGLVKDFAARLIAQFARNLSADLAGEPLRSDGNAMAISAGTMLWSMLWNWVRGRVGR
jgi:aerobic carbon-monoxide dehydrogenase small subunit